MKEGVDWRVNACSLGLYMYSNQQVGKFLRHVDVGIRAKLLISFSEHCDSSTVRLFNTKIDNSQVEQQCSSQVFYARAKELEY